MKKLRWIIFSVVTFILVFYLYFKEGPAKIANVFSNIDAKYLIIAIVLQIASTMVSAMNTHYFRLKFQKISYLFTLHSKFFGVSIGALLPGFLSAGAVSEISIMNLQGLDVHKSTSMALVTQIGYFIALAITPTVAILCNLSYFKEHSTLLLNILFAVGFFINFLTIFFYAFISRANNLLYKIAKLFVDFLAFLRIVKNKEKLLEKIRNTLDAVKNQMSNLHFKWYDWLFAVSASSINMVIGNAVSYFCAFALGINLTGKFWNMLACSGFVSAIAATLPVPSGIGISDLAYSSIMAPLVGNEIAFLHLFWRLVTFYLPIIISVIVMAFPIPRPKKLREQV